MLWYDPNDNSVFSFGGWPYLQETGYTIYSFQPDGHGGAVWEQSFGTSDVLWQSFVAPFGAQYASSSKAFYIHGATEIYINNSISGLAVFDFQKYDWANDSSSGYSDSGYGVLGEAQYVPISGSDGVLVFLGGSTPQNQTFQYHTGIDLSSMSNITIYDINAGQWYHQTATGDIPSPRTEFCMVGVSAADNSSYEM